MTEESKPSNRHDEEMKNLTEIKLYEKWLTKILVSFERVCLVLKIQWGFYLVLQEGQFRSNFVLIAYI